MSKSEYHKTQTNITIKTRVHALFIRKRKPMSIIKSPFLGVNLHVVNCIMLLLI